MTESGNEEIIAFAVILGLFGISGYVLWSFIRPRRSEHSLRTVTILVLGDIGRSPRMMYHAESLANLKFTVNIVGYGGSDLTNALTESPYVHPHCLAPFPPSLAKLPFVLLAPLKIAHQLLSIFVVLLLDIREPPEYLLVQNPPTIPTLAIAWFIGWARGSRVIIDWHNLGYTILGLKLGEQHLFVRLSAKFERYFGRTAYAHIFVTKAMKDRLTQDWSLEGHKVVLHDRPPRHFHKAQTQEIHDLFCKISKKFSPSQNDFLPEYSLPSSTPFSTTDKESSMAMVGTPTFHEVLNTKLRPDRPALVVSSTSWTADEDFSILLGALETYEQNARNMDGKLPKVLMIVTGKGPLKDYYMEKITKLEVEQAWQFVRVISAWLSPGDYPILLGSADLGISLHSSSSGIDLPMKVVDMFGCGLPVCALDFECLGELVKPGINGVTFTTQDALAQQLTELLHNFPNPPKLEALQKSLRGRTTTASSSRPSPSPANDEVWHWNSWEENWTSKVKPLLKL